MNDQSAATTRRSAALFAPGLIDVGAASLASFASGLYAARYFEPSLLGVYAVFFSAFIAVVLFPTQLVFLPTEVQLLEVERPQRGRGLPKSWRLGALIAVIAAPLVLLSLVATQGEASSADLMRLSVTAVIATVLSPLQDHARRLQHLSGRSWNAAIVSTAQLTGAAATIVIGISAGVEPTLIPFGALIVANTLSLTAAMLLMFLSNRSTVLTGLSVDVRGLMTSGRWLLLEGLLPPASRLLAGGIVIALAGADELGFAEAGRVTARPVLVAATGLAAITDPVAMEAGRAGSLDALAPLIRRAYVLVPLAGVAWLLLAGPNWSGNVLVDLLPTAYEIPWLTATIIVASTLFQIALAERAYMLGSKRVRRIASIEVFGSILLIAAALTAPVTGAFAIPLGLGAIAATRVFGYRHSIRQLALTKA